MDSDEDRVRNLINAMFRGAGLNIKYSGDVNEEVAAIVGKMLIELRQCSDAFAWVPRPIGGKATISWIARNIARSMIAQMRNSQSFTCMRGVIYKWRGELRRKGRAW